MSSTILHTDFHSVHLSFLFVIPSPAFVSIGRCRENTVFFSYVLLKKKEN